jgi:hypothetical protein
MLEQVAARFITPCKYVDSGCDARLDYERKAVHERDCEFRPVRCLINDCKWEGRPSALAAHMTGNECSIIVGDNRGINFASGEIAHLGLCGHDGLNGWVVFLLKAFDHDFICYVRPPFFGNGTLGLSQRTPVSCYDRSTTRTVCALFSGFRSRFACLVDVGFAPDQDSVCPCVVRRGQLSPLICVSCLCCIRASFAHA